MAVGGEVGANVALVVPLGFITCESVKEPGDVVNSPTGLFGKGPQRALVGPHQSLQRGAVQRNTGGIYRHAHRGNLKVITDPGQHVKPFFLGDLFG